MDKKLLNLTDLAKYLGIAETTLRLWIKDGRFPVKPVENLEPKRWNVEDVDAWRGVAKDAKL